MYFYAISIILMVICAGIGARASAKVKAAFGAYGKMATKSHMTGYDTAVRLLRRGGANDIAVGRVRGELTDHYHPTKKIVNLSDSVYGDDSIASVAVAAHEVGHVMQKKAGYFPYKVRTALVPITNFGSKLAVPLVLIGCLLDLMVLSTGSQIGYYLALVGVALYGLSTVFAFVTLPVELDASRRAKQMLVDEGILQSFELPYADKMLDAAANTYVASLVTSALYFLRFALWVLMMFGGGRRRR